MAAAARERESLLARGRVELLSPLLFPHARFPALSDRFCMFLRHFVSPPGRRSLRLEPTEPTSQQCTYFSSSATRGLLARRTVCLSFLKCEIAAPGRAHRRRLHPSLPILSERVWAPPRPRARLLTSVQDGRVTGGRRGTAVHLPSQAARGLVSQRG